MRWWPWSSPLVLLGGGQQGHSVGRRVWSCLLPSNVSSGKGEVVAMTTPSLVFDDISSYSLLLQKRKREKGRNGYGHVTAPISLNVKRKGMVVSQHPYHGMAWHGRAGGETQSITFPYIV